MTTSTKVTQDESVLPVAQVARRKRVRWLLIGVGALAVLALVVLAVIPPLVIGGMVNQHVAFSQTWSGEEFGLSPQEVRLTTADGLQVVAYEVAAENPKAVIIFLSGMHNPSVTAFFGHARMLLEQGYASILLEMRAHGESEGEVISLGYTEHLDVLAAVKYVRENGRYAHTPIVVYGLSMGGATAINAIGQIPEIDGLISLSAFSAWDDVFLDNMGAPKLVSWVQRPFVRLYTTLKYGRENQTITPKNQVQKLGDRPALLIHSTEDSQVPFANFERLLANAPAHVETWTRQGDLHFIVQPGSFLNPEEDAAYAARISQFLDHHFGGE